MIGLGAAVLAGALWTGTAQVDVLILEGGGEHPYTTDFALQYSEEGRTPVLDANGAVVAHRIRLLPQRVFLRARHEVRGLLNCTGGGEELVADAPEAEIVLPVKGGPASYQLVLPRALGSFACGTQRNAVDRRVGIGSGLFHADLEVEDAAMRSLQEGGSRMRGAYKKHQERNYNVSAQHNVRYDFDVTWDLRRAEAP